MPAPPPPPPGFSGATLWIERSWCYPGEKVTFVLSFAADQRVKIGTPVKWTITTDGGDRLAAGEGIYRSRPMQVAGEVVVKRVSDNGPWQLRADVVFQDGSPALHANAWLMVYVILTFRRDPNHPEDKVYLQRPNISSEIAIQNYSDFDWNVPFRLRLKLVNNYPFFDELNISGLEIEATGRILHLNGNVDTYWSMPNDTRGPLRLDGGRRALKFGDTLVTEVGPIVFTRKDPDSAVGDIDLAIWCQPVGGWRYSRIDLGTWPLRIGFGWKRQFVEQRPFKKPTANHWDSKYLGCCDRDALGDDCTKLPVFSIQLADSHEQLGAAAPVRKFLNAELPVSEALENSGSSATDPLRFTTATEQRGARPPNPRESRHLVIVDPAPFRANHPRHLSVGARDHFLSPGSTENPDETQRPDRHSSLTTLQGEDVDPSDSG